MSNAQRRTAFQHRRRRFPGPHDGESSYNLPAFQLGTRAASMMAVVRRNQASARRAANLERLIPTSGPGRRRAKAHRNAGLCLHPGGGVGLCPKKVVGHDLCEDHQPALEAANDTVETT